MKSRPLTSKLLAIAMMAGCLAFSSAFVQETGATIMPYPAKIDALAKSSDLVAKIKVLSIDSGQVESASLKNPFWEIRRAHIEIISPIKGNTKSSKVDLVFRSAEPTSKQPTMWIDVGPENYPHFDLAAGSCYIVFMKQAGGDSFEQVSHSFGLRSWEGFFSCPDDAAIKSGATVQNAVWSELTRALSSKENAVQASAALTLLDISAGHESNTIGSGDFDRKDVIAAIIKQPGALSDDTKDDKTLKTLIHAFGSGSPYLDESTRMRYFWSKAAQPMSSWSGWTAKNHLANTEAISSLISIADGKHSPDVCAEAILSLGGCQSTSKTQPSISSSLQSWLKSPAPEIRAAACMLSADYPEGVKATQIESMLQDRAPKVRQAAAYSLGLMRPKEAVTQLAMLFSDPDQDVQGFAGLCMMAYQVADVKSVLTANLNTPAFSEAFLARLASDDTASVRDKLLAKCKQYKELSSPDQLSHMNIAFQNGLGTSPGRLCMEALVKYLDDQTGAQLQKPEFVPYLQCIEKVGAEDASYTGKVYEILISHSLNDRAKAFRKQAKATQPTIPDIAFEQPDMLLRAGNLKLK